MAEIFFRQFSSTIEKPHQKSVWNTSIGWKSVTPMSKSWTWTFNWNVCSELTFRVQTIIRMSNELTELASRYQSFCGNCVASIVFSLDVVFSCCVCYLHHIALRFVLVGKHFGIYHAIHARNYTHLWATDIHTFLSFKRLNDALNIFGWKQREAYSCRSTASNWHYLHCCHWHRHRRHRHHHCRHTDINSIIVNDINPIFLFCLISAPCDELMRMILILRMRFIDKIHLC